MSLRDLFVRLKIDVSGAEKLEKVDKAVKKTTSSFERLGRVMNRFTGLLSVAAVGLFVEHLVTQGDALKHSAEALGITTDELQKFQYVSTQMQVPVQQVAVALRFFNRAIGEASFGGKAASQAFARVGINIRDAHGNIRPTSDLLFDFADHLQKIPSQAQRTAIAMRTLGRGGAAMLPVLQQGSKALREMFADVEELGGGFDEDFTKKAHELVHQQARLSMGWKTMAGLLGKELFPMLTRFAERGIKNVKILIDWAKHSYFLRTALMALPVAIGAVATAWAIMNIEMLPTILLVGALVAAFGALYLVFDDLYTFTQGGDSVIGDLLNSITGGKAKEVLDGIVTAFTAVKEALFGADASGKSLAATLVSAFASAIPGMVEWGGKFLLAVVQTIDEAITRLREFKIVLSTVFAGDKAFRQGEVDIAKIEASRQDRSDKMVAAWRALNGLTTPIPAPGVAPAIVGGGPGVNASADEQNPGRTTGGHSADLGENNPGRTTGGALPAIHIVQHFNGPTDPKKVQDATADGVKSGLKDAATQHRDTYDAVHSGQPTYTGVGSSAEPGP